MGSRTTRQPVEPAAAGLKSDSHTMSRLLAWSGLQDTERRAATRHIPRRTFMLVYAPPLFFLAVVMAAHLLVGLDLGVVSRDQVQEFHLHPLSGVQSTIGGVVWLSSAAIVGITVAVLGYRKQWEADRTRFLAGLGLVTFALGVDDLFMVHDELVPRYIGLDEKVFMLLYAGATIALLLRYRLVFLSLRPLLLLSAAGFLALSVGVDLFQEVTGAGGARIFYEDGAKFLGLFGWAGYQVRLCWDFLTEPWTPARHVIRLDPPTQRDVNLRDEIRSVRQTVAPRPAAVPPQIPSTVPLSLLPPPSPITLNGATAQHIVELR